MTRLLCSSSDPSPALGILPVPDWIARGGRDVGNTQSPEDALFLAGAALAHLHPVAAEQEAAREVPMRLLRDRMALGAAEAGIVRSGGRARMADLRDRIGFLAPGARMDPETARFARWRRAINLSLRGQGVPEAMLGEIHGGYAEAEIGIRRKGAGIGTSFESPNGMEAEIGAIWRAAGEGGDPIGIAAGMIAAGRRAWPDDPDAPLLLADAALARALGWPYLLPLLATRLARRDLALEGAALRQACARAVTRAAIRAARLAVDLARRAGRLRIVAPRLRAKASDAAVSLFLARDAVAPMSDLAPVVRGTRITMSPRAATRLCDRLVALGVVRELTGRTTFRLYGL